MSMANRWLKRIVENPRLQLIAGLTLLGMTLFGEFFQPHHGFILISGYWIAQAVPNLIQALERIYKGTKQ